MVTPKDEFISDIQNLRNALNATEALLLKFNDNLVKFAADGATTASTESAQQTIKLLMEAIAETQASYQDFKTKTSFFLGVLESVAEETP